jgi:hypothetical protein
VTLKVKDRTVTTPEVSPMVGMGLLFLLVILIVIIGGVGLWVRQSRPEAHAAGAAPAVVEESQNHISLLTEAVGYVGTILVLAGASAAVGQHWRDIGTTGQLAILAVATLIFLGIGLLLRSSTEPASQRLTSVTWAVSVVAFAGSVAVATQSADLSGEATGLLITTTSTGYAAVLWAIHQHAIQQAVLFFGVVVSTVTIILNLVQEPDGWMIALPLWAIGVGWAAAGWWRRIDPWFIAVPLGLIVALIAPATIDQPSALRFGLGIATAGVVMALSVAVRFIPGLAMASVALLGYVIGAVTYYFGDTLGVPASLTIAGLLILTLAAVATRWHWFSRKQPTTVEPSSPEGDSPNTSLEHHHAA